MGTGGHEDVHWGQCFEEFYGAEYCKNLKKDLEKLKDEFYDGNAQRFQREWVLPTANLLRRLQRMVRGHFLFCFVKAFARERVMGRPSRFMEVPGYYYESPEKIVRHHSPPYTKFVIFFLERS